MARIIRFYVPVSYLKKAGKQSVHLGERGKVISITSGMRRKSA